MAQMALYTRLQLLHGVWHPPSAVWRYLTFPQAALRVVPDGPASWKSHDLGEQPRWHTLP
jgi:hypothetical protein